MPEETSLLLSRLARRYGLVACISGRSAAEARRLVGVGGIAYAGSHGAELLEPGAARPATDPAFAELGGTREEFVADRDNPELRRLRVRIEDKGPIAALHWRGAPDEDAARARVEALAARGRGRRAGHPLGPQGAGAPPAGARSTRARRCAAWWSCRPRARRCSGATTPPTSTPSTRSRRWSARARSTRRSAWAWSSDEGPRAIVERADLVVDGVDGFAQRAGGAGRAVRFRDFLRVSRAALRRRGHRRWRWCRSLGAADEETNTLVYVAAVWWCVATLAGPVAGPPARRHARHRPLLVGRAAQPTRCPSSSPARSCSTGSGR